MMLACSISNKTARNWDLAYQMISCVRLWSGHFSPDCNEKGLQIVQVLFNIVIVVTDQDKIT
jgi:hypothetical protein